MEFIVEYKTTGGYYWKCDGSFLIEEVDEATAKIKAKEMVYDMTGGAYINEFSIRTLI